MRIFLTTKIWEEGKHFIAYTPELDLASQGKTPERAEKRLHEAVTIFLEEIKSMGTLEEVMRGAGFLWRGRKWEVPRISISTMDVAL